MAKSLSDILRRYNDVISGKTPASEINALTTGENPGVDYADKMKDTRDFIAQHSVEKFDDRVGNGDDVYQAANVKKAKMERHGHENPKDKKVYKKANQQTNEETDLEEGSKYYEDPTGQAKRDMTNKYVQLRQIAHKKKMKKKKLKEEDLEEASKCNMTEAGKMCEVHGMKACPPEKKTAADKQPMYNGRQLIVDRQLKERQMTATEKKKEEKLKDKYDDSDMKSSMMKQYGAEKGKQVYFAYIRKKAMKNEQAAPADTHIATPSGLVGDTGRV